MQAGTREVFGLIAGIIVDLALQALERAVKLSSNVVVFVLAAISLVGLIVIQLVQHSIPDSFSTLTFTLVGASAGIAVPGTGTPKLETTPTTLTLTPSA